MDMPTLSRLMPVVPTRWQRALNEDPLSKEPVYLTSSSIALNMIDIDDPSKRLMLFLFKFSSYEFNGLLKMLVAAPASTIVFDSADTTCLASSNVSHSCFWDRGNMLPFVEAPHRLPRKNLTQIAWEDERYALIQSHVTNDYGGSLTNVDERKTFNDKLNNGRALAMMFVPIALSGNLTWTAVGFIEMEGY